MLSFDAPKVFNFNEVKFIYFVVVVSFAFGVICSFLFKEWSHITILSPHCRSVSFLDVSSKMCSTPPWKTKFVLHEPKEYGIVQWLEHDSEVRLSGSEICSATLLCDPGQIHSYFCASLSSSINLSYNSTLFIGLLWGFNEAITLVSRILSLQLYESMYIGC